MPVQANPYPWLTPNGLWKPITFFALSATGLVSMDVFQSDGYYQVRDVRESHATASTSGTLQVEVLTSGQAADAGVDQMTSVINLAATANIPQVGTMIETPTQINPGDRVGVVFGGTLTSLVGLSVVVHLERIRKGEV